MESTQGIAWSAKQYTHVNQLRWLILHVYDTQHSQCPLHKYKTS